MDFLDPKKQRRHAILLYTGYLFIGIAIVISTIVLVYQANGYGVNSKGQVVQNGLVFFSTNPSAADIRLNDKLYKNQTNTRISMPTGQYNVRLSREGYRDWTRDINVIGGDVQNYDYPFLFPTTLTNTSEASYDTAPGIATQSRDRRWLAVQQGVTTTFDVYDLREDTLTSAPITIPANLVSTAPGNQSWEAVQWANDNEHFLLKHTNGDAVEFILVDRANPNDSVNLNQTLNASPKSVALIDNKFDQYHLLEADGRLRKATLSEPAPTVLLEGVLDFKSYGSDQVLFATTVDAPAGKTLIKLSDGDNQYTVRQVTVAPAYQLDIAEFQGAQYVALASSAESTAYVYKDVLKQLEDPKVITPTALRALRVANASSLSFSPNTRYIVGQNGTQFAVYDIYLKRSYVYKLDSPLDAPQTEARWMDGERLTYISGGKQVVFDFDGKNYQTLSAATVQQGTFFSQDYRYVFEFAPNNSNVTQLYRTPLRTAADL